MNSLNIAVEFKSGVSKSTGNPYEVVEFTFPNGHVKRCFLGKYDNKIIFESGDIGLLKMIWQVSQKSSNETTPI